MTITQNSHPELDALYGNEAPTYTADGGLSYLGMRPMHIHCDWKTDTAPSGKKWLVCGRCGYRILVGP